MLESYLLTTLYFCLQLSNMYVVENIKVCNIKTKILGRLNKYVSTNSFFLDLILLCLGLFNYKNWGQRYKVNTIKNFTHLFHSCKTRNIGLGKKDRKKRTTCNIQRISRKNAQRCENFLKTLMYFEIFGYLVQLSNQKLAIIKEEVLDQPENNGKMTSHSNFEPSRSNFKVSFRIQFVNFRFSLVSLEKFGYHKQSFNAKPFTVKQGMSNQWSKHVSYKATGK